MRRILLLPLLIACVDARSDERAAPRPEPVAVRPTPSTDSSIVPAPVVPDAMVAEADSTVVGYDAAGRPRVPIVLRGDCEGEECQAEFRAAVCEPTALRAAPVASAPIVTELAEDDTVDVRRDLHVKQVGVVVLKRGFVLDRDIGDVENPTPPPRSDTVRFARGDTLYLIQYLSLGSWRWAHHGTQHDSYMFWSEPPGGGPARSDSSRAAGRSVPVTEDWWYVRPPRGVPGWWLGTDHDELVSTTDQVRGHDCP
jgi:hypothetical protein